MLYVAAIYTGWCFDVTRQQQLETITCDVRSEDIYSLIESIKLDLQTLQCLCIIALLAHHQTQIRAATHVFATNVWPEEIDRFLLFPD